jgi:hypothetical protein
MVPILADLLIVTPSIRAGQGEVIPIVVVAGGDKASSLGSVAVASTFTFCILRNKIGKNLKIFEEIAAA